MTQFDLYLINSIFHLPTRIQVMTIIFIVGVIQAFFICLILLNKKNKSLSDKILTVWIFVTARHRR